MKNNFRLLTLFLSIVLTMCMISVPALALEPNSIEVSEFDYDNVSITINGRIGESGEKTVAVYIISDGIGIDSLSDGNLPIFADIITTNDLDGTFSLPVKFMSDGSPFGLPYGKYEVYLYSKDLGLGNTLSDGFVYLSPAQILERDRNKILTDVQDSQTWQGMRDVILAQNSDGQPLSDAAYIEGLIGLDKSVYNTLTDLRQFWVDLYDAKANIVVFNDVTNDIKTQFESIAIARKTAETLIGNTEDDTYIPSVSGGGGFSSAPAIKTDPAINNDTPSGGQNSGFSDMSGHWAEAYVNTLAKNGVLNGYEDGSFAPENWVTRAELVKIIAAAFDIMAGGTGDFTDVLPTDWFAPYVYSAMAAGIVNGFDGQFNPNAPVTRQDAAVMIHRAISRTHKLNIGYVFFADETSIAPYAAEQTSALAEIGVITGNTENQFLPLNSLTRAEAAALISRASDYIIAH